MDQLEQKRDADEQEKAGSQPDDQHFDPWEQAFHRDFQKREREFEF